MSERTGADRSKRTGLVLWRFASSFWQRGLRLLWSLDLATARSPARLLIAPPDIRTADPTVAADIYAGYFVFDGKGVNTHGHSPFAIASPSEGWARALAEFGWLRHLRAADTSLARVNGRALVSDWIGQIGNARSLPAWDPETASLRIIAWLSQSPIVLEGADGVFYRKFMLSVGRHAVFLRRALATGLTGEARLYAAIALTEIGLCAEGFSALQRQGTRILLDEVGIQILADGGHISRNPSLPVDLLLHMLPLRQAFVAAGAPVPPALLGAIDRMMLMIRALRHGDGALAMFNGMSVTRPEALAVVLAYDDARGRPLSSAPYSGYQRLEGGAAVLVIDCGRPPPVDFSRSAHAGTLAFEFSVGSQQLIVNCGAPDGGSVAMRQAARATAAHSTLVLADRSSCRFVEGQRFGSKLRGLLYAGPHHVPFTREDDGMVSALEASHDGYVARFGLVHRRRLALAASGERLNGKDRLEGSPARGRWRSRRSDAAFAVRFHLHPSLRARIIREDTAVLVALPSGDIWLFEAGGRPVRIEESIYFASPDGPRRTDQIVVPGHSREASDIEWSLSRWNDGIG